MSDGAHATSSDSGRGLTRAIAFHLPQFHPIPENDEWWGKGFTEWTNVTKAKPLFPGHYQPHLPADLGFYDLRLPEVRAAQARLATEYGIYGFCYYHYWFSGRQVLERPVNEILDSGEPEFPFCLCWANEDWTRAWDGTSGRVLLKQEYSPADDLAHIRALMPFFQDRRYICVDGRPLFAVYRTTQLSNPQRTTDLWRREAEASGLKGLFLARIEASGGEIVGDPQSSGFDAAIEFQPHWEFRWQSRIFRRKWWHRHKIGTGEAAFREHLICRYEDMVERALAWPATAYLRIPCVCPGWDNSPRRRREATVYIGSTPELYERWLRETVLRQATRIPEGGGPESSESLVFINAWNEWAEGNHLEPCQRWGRSYLEATRRALAAAKSGSRALLETAADAARRESVREA